MKQNYTWKDRNCLKWDNLLQVGPLQREDLGTVLTCQANNNNISLPISTRSELRWSWWWYAWVLEMLLLLFWISDIKMIAEMVCKVPDHLTRVTLDMVFPPTDVSITSIGQPLSAGTQYEVRASSLSILNSFIINIIFIIRHHHQYHYPHRLSLKSNIELPKTFIIIKHRKNCECCPGHYLIVNHYSSMSWLKFRIVSNSQLCH